MSVNRHELLTELRTDFEAMLNLVTGPEAQTATLNQMERSRLRHLLRMGRKLLQVFLAHRAEVESHTPPWGWQRRKLLYPSQKAVDYLSVLGKLAVRRAYFYASGYGGKTPRDRALSWPERCYSDLLMECAELLAVDSAYDKATQVLARLLGVNVSVLARETTVAEHSQAVLSFYAQRAAFSRREEGPILIAHADGKGVRLVRDEAPPTGRRRKGDKKTHKKEAIAGAATSHAAKALRRVAGYLQRNLPYMDDARYWKLGWPIGTGVIEGACRHLVKDRRELSGMRWTVPGAEALLALRAVQRNDDWDTFQQFRRQQRHKQLDGKPLTEAWIDPVERLEINQI